METGPKEDWLISEVWPNWVPLTPVDWLAHLDFGAWAHRGGIWDYFGIGTFWIPDSFTVTIISPFKTL